MTDPDFTAAEADEERLGDLVEQILARESAPGPVNWRQVTSTQAGETWRELAAFVQWLTHRYQLPLQEVPPCWYLHGALVEELTALRGMWQVCYDKTQAASAMADFHRTLYETRHRLREWSARTNCQQAEHRADRPQPWVTSHGDADWHPGFTRHVAELIGELARTEPVEREGDG